MKLLRKIFVELTTCPDNKTVSTAKVAFWILLFLSIIYAFFIVKDMTFGEFTQGLATIFGIGSAPVIGEEMSDRRGGMKDGSVMKELDDRGNG